MSTHIQDLNIELLANDSSTPKNIVAFSESVIDGNTTITVGTSKTGANTWTTTPGDTIITGDIRLHRQSINGPTISEIQLLANDSSTPKNVVGFAYATDSDIITSSDWQIHYDNNGNAKCNYPPQIGMATIE